MRIRAPFDAMPVTQRTALAACLLLAGCGFIEQPVGTEADEPVDQAGSGLRPSQTSDPLPRTLAATTPSEECLLLIWQDEPPARRNFDRRNDEVEGGAISCATGTTPSQFEDTIEAVRLAAQSGDRAAILREVGVPLLYIDAEGKRRRIPSDVEVDTLFEQIFTPDVVETLADLKLDDMAVTPQQGGDFRLGGVWLAVPEPGGRPRIVTINHQALGEARGSPAVVLPQSES